MANAEDLLATDREESKKKGHKDRSPNYPVIDLGGALEKAEAIHKEFRVHEAPVGIVQERWGFKAHSGFANQYIAALKAYGLLNVTGQGDQRKVSISVDADRILRNAPDKNELLKAAALRPALHNELWDYYKDKGGVPPDELLRHYLVWDRPEPKFNEKSVDGFIERFRRTLTFANLATGDIIDKPGSGGQSGNSHPEPKVGDFVQWTSGGVCQLSEPKRVLGVSDDGQFAFVDGSQTGLPMSELTTTTPDPCVSLPIAVPPASPFFKPKPPEEEDMASAGLAKERLTLDEGPVVLSWPATLSQDSVFDLEGWLEVVIKRARRKAGIKDEKAAEG
ncbi:MAG: hypothetical protein LLF97_06780 [Planctomycetaceae bacterium]|nr:hypothetical protein [Planctomycetaceae bacterium]